MTVIGIISSKCLGRGKKAPKEKRHNPRWRDKNPSAYQINVANEVKALLKLHRNVRRAEIYDLLQKRYGLVVEIRRHYTPGGVGSSTWLPRRGCIRIQVGASRIDSKKLCYRYAPVVEIYDNWHTL